MTMNNFLEEIKTALNKKILYLPHAIRQMSRPDRMISPEEVRNVIEQGEIIEDYPNDQRGHSCLMFRCNIGDRPLHVVCAPKVDYLAIITAYIPSMEEWEGNDKKRKKNMKCIHCQGNMKKGTAPLHIDRKNCHLTLDNIPAWICSQCGEVYFEENEVSAVQDLIMVIDQKAQPLAATA